MLRNHRDRVVLAQGKARMTRHSSRPRLLLMAALFAFFLIPNPVSAQPALFDAPSDYTAGANPYSVVVADFDGDGRPDLAVANHGSSNVSVLLASGDGMFRAGSTIAVGAN